MQTHKLREGNTFIHVATQIWMQTDDTDQSNTLKNEIIVCLVDEILYSSLWLFLEILYSVKLTESLGSIDADLTNTFSEMTQKPTSCDMKT